jgi:glycosyltransferase involved in cell wall biosynthesis
MELHVGIHGSLLQSPPPHVVFQRCHAAHLFLFPAESGKFSGRSPLTSPHWGEFVRINASGIIHTARWPALGVCSWVTDMDDFGYPVLAGRYAYSSDFRKAFRETWGAELAEHIRRRAVCMLTAYAHPSCAAILFRTQRAVKIAQEWILRLGVGEIGEEFLRKTEVVYPAQKISSFEHLKEKWLPRSRLRIVFCGRDYMTKNGALATKIFAKLATRYPNNEFLYVGALPPEAEGESLRFPVNFLRLGERSHGEVLDLLRQSHVLFHPAHTESFGMIFLEAAAAGLAIVCAGGAGTSHLSEFLSPSGIASLDADNLLPAEELDKFTAVLESVLNDFAKAKSMALSNYEMAAHGEISIERRNRQLTDIYDRAASCISKAELCLEDLPYSKEASIIELSEGGLRSELLRFRNEIGLVARNIYF